jgi:hypothetical protein
LDPCYKVYVVDINEEGEIESWILHMAMYGLKQAGHKWYEKLRRIVEEGSSLKHCIGDEGTYTSNDSLIETHVHDFLAIGTKEKLDEVKQRIKNHVELDKCGKPKQMLGIELHYGKDGVLLTQQGLIESLAQQHRVSGVKHSLPLDYQYFVPRKELDEPCNTITVQ